MREFDEIFLNYQTRSKNVL